MMGEAVRAVMFGLIICLHVNYRPDDRSSQPTLAKLKRTLQAYGLTSPRRVEALIARLVQVGYLRTEAAPGDRRARLLVRSEEPTSELQSLMRNSYAVFRLKKKKQNHKIKTILHKQ